MMKSIVNGSKFILFVCESEINGINGGGENAYTVYRLCLPRECRENAETVPREYHLCGWVINTAGVSACLALLSPQ